MAESGRISSALQIGTSVLLSLAAGVVLYNQGDVVTTGTNSAATQSGSTVTAGGGTFQGTNLADAACRKDSTTGRYYDCYQDSTLTDTGSCVAGGCATKGYVVASIQKPYSGSGVIKRIEFTCDGQGKAGRLWVNQGASATAATSGSSLTNLAGVTFGSGATVVFSTGSVRWSETTPYLNLYSGVDVGSSGCLFSVDSDEVYNP